MILVLLGGAIKRFYDDQDVNLEKKVYAKPIEQVVGSRNLPAPKDHEESFYRTQADSVKTYNRLLDKFKGSHNSSTLMQNEMAEETERYPDYYGGAYIDQDIGQLVVLVKEEALSIKAAATKIASLTSKTTTSDNESEANTIRLETCKVSYNEMLEVQEYLSEQMDSLYEQGVEITSLAIDIMAGGVEVSIKDLNKEKEMIVNSLVDCTFL